MIRLTKTGAWGQVAHLLATAPQRVHAAFDKALLQEAQLLRTKVVEGIREQAPGGRAFTPLAPTTLAIRRFRGFAGTKALLVHGDLRNSITVVKEADAAFVGVLRTAKGRDGRSLVDIAALHEHGSRPIVMTLTPKARAFLHAAFRRAGLDAPAHRSSAIAVIQIPPRPIFGPVFERYAQPAEVSRRFLARVAALLGRDFGTP
ncbi:MAG TPA: phage virion morphogenesis protein [Kofleriaceae bacterium]|nr:phage virion morphogenesis protein [Kofleriaceae bacterium]